MNRKHLAFACTAVLAVTLTASSVFAANHIKLIINGKEIKTSIPLQVSKDNIIAPLRPLAEALGASVEWDNKNQTVSITDTERIRAIQLESALYPTDRLSAATLWAKSAATRNGALRYAILSPELKKEQYSDYKELNWVIGGSSPWVESYKINEIKSDSADTYNYKIDYVLTDSTSAKYSAEENISIKKFSEHGADYWFITEGSKPSYGIPFKDEE